MDFHIIYNRKSGKSWNQGDQEIFFEIQKALKHEDSGERRIQIRKEINQLMEDSNYRMDQINGKLANLDQYIQQIENPQI